MNFKFWERKEPAQTPQTEVEIKSGNDFWMAAISSSAYQTQSATLAACMSYGQRAIADVELVAENYDGKTWVDGILPAQITKDSLKSGLSFTERLQATYTDSYLGNALWLKLRNGRNQVTGFQFIPWNNITVNKSSDGTRIVSYSVNGTTYNASDVIHFRFGIEPGDHLLGFNKLTAIRTLIEADYLSQVYQAALVTAPAPGHILSAKGKLNATQKQIDKLTTQYKELTSSRNAGGVMVITDAEWDITPIKFSPADLDITKLADFIEERICAVVGVPSIVVGLGANQATYNNIQSAQRQAAVNHVIPFLQTVAKSLVEQCPELFFNPDLRLRFKVEDMSAMQTDLDSESKRIGDLYRNGAISRGQAQSALGYDPAPEDYSIWNTSTVHNTQETNNNGTGN